MSMNRRSLFATAAVAAMSVGLAPQALATTGAGAATEAAATAGNAERAAGYLKQWMFDPNHTHHPLYAKTSFNGPASRNTNLKNSLERKFLQWEPQKYGIHLGWTDDASPTTAVAVSRWFFTRTDTTHPIRYGDTVAMGYGISPSYIYYVDRTFGINLDWSTAPRYEWKLLGGRIGEEVRSGDWLAIYNTVTKQPLIYFDRTFGADIGWPNSETWSQQLADAVMKFIHDHWAEGVVYLLRLV